MKIIGVDDALSALSSPPEKTPPGANTEAGYASPVPEVTESAVTTYAVIPFLATSVPKDAKRHPAITADPHDSYIPDQEKLSF